MRFDDLTNTERATPRSAQGVGRWWRWTRQLATGGLIVGGVLAFVPLPPGHAGDSAPAPATTPGGAATPTAEAGSDVKLTSVNYRGKAYLQAGFQALAAWPLGGIESPYYATKEEVAALNKDLPAVLRPLNGQAAQAIGYMFPLKWNKDGEVTEFLLMKSQGGCCYGRFPELNGLVYCFSETGAPYKMDVPLVCYGRLAVSAAETGPDGPVTLYRMQVEHVDVPLDTNPTAPVAAPGLQ